MTARGDIQLIGCAQLAPATSRVADERRRDHRRVVLAEPQFDYVRSAIVPVVNPLQGGSSRSAARASIPADAHPGWPEGDPAQRFCPASTAARSDSSALVHWPQTGFEDIASSRIHRARGTSGSISPKATSGALDRAKGGFVILAVAIDLAAK